VRELLDRDLDLFYEENEVYIGPNGNTSDEDASDLDAAPAPQQPRRISGNDVALVGAGDEEDDQLLHGAILP